MQSFSLYEDEPSSLDPTIASQTASLVEENMPISEPSPESGEGSFDENNRDESGNDDATTHDSQTSTSLGNNMLTDSTKTEIINPVSVLDAAPPVSSVASSLSTQPPPEPSTPLNQDADEAR